ncbi:helix-turn-helix domain-containing protein [Ectothiorhodospira haloalkaliphila]|uniref:helix-turn-helix domain-containing protein n=1 Tax=Ectothiorhodospira haloalkaliphila TaxID=421628 RepID=UPI001EE8424C|nr:helix-turn-helix domain-containing protein [Ectothiorhodospira haloalkaliphila]MCG5525935.1 helix-turn-helix domain-containing protein [Ectothiorhodospira haloalkaliphila]
MTVEVKQRALEVMGQVSLPASAKLVFFLLADMSNEDSECWPGQRGLARKLGLSIGTVKEAIRSLKAEGLIVAHPRFNLEKNEFHSNIYQVLVNDLPESGEDYSLESEEDYSLESEEDCSLESEEDCSLESEEDCSLESEEDYSPESEEDCSLESEEDCSPESEEDCLPGGGSKIDPPGSDFDPPGSENRPLIDNHSSVSSLHTQTTGATDSSSGVCDGSATHKTPPIQIPGMPNALASRVVGACQKTGEDAQVLGREIVAQARQGRNPAALLSDLVTKLCNGQYVSKAALASNEPRCAAHRDYTGRTWELFQDPQPPSNGGPKAQAGRNKRDSKRDPRNVARKEQTFADLRRKIPLLRTSSSEAETTSSGLRA